ncbi:NAD(P)-dependent oxidoreductase [Tianweitania sp. BSSL-BM11]|uniref:NAD(P)-dependent oxidoreductase n=1 Tax=Tianweitania aestuarii TaxID=2814886 RepID=A0ABS5RUR1_9HYPH|nr:NAD(P)-dependent oxidoreductase [Tianweitania aestuarii]MBS9720697.1 NAD(P)-dependent oxidoreductase [Tianweitania aestuarii]
MKIALIGATGFVGKEVLTEAVSRGHTVTALVRNPDKVPALEGVTAAKVDASDPDALGAVLAGHDLVISAFNGGWGDPDIYTKHMTGSRAIAKASEQAGIPLIAIGGAGSLHAADGSQFVDGPDFPADYKPGATAARDALDELKAGSWKNWTFLSPAFQLEPGTRRGIYRTGLDSPVVDEEGTSKISASDLAVAILDEAEMPKHRGRRFTVGY